MTKTKTALTFNLIAERFGFSLDGYKATVAKFAEKLAVDPAYAMKWGDDAVRAAGACEVFEFVVSCAKNSDNDALEAPQVLLETIVEQATERILYAAKYPSRSTSPMANLIDAAKATAWSEVLEDAKSMIALYGKK